MTTSQDIPYGEIDGAPVPLDECIWLARRPCGCLRAALVAHIDETWTYPTAESARAHLAEDAPRREALLMEMLRIELVTSDVYRSQYRLNWKCEEHTT